MTKTTSLAEVKTERQQIAQSSDGSFRILERDRYRFSDCTSPRVGCLSSASFVAAENRPHPRHSFTHCTEALCAILTVSAFTTLRDHPFTG